MKKATLIAVGVFAVLLVAVLATREEQVNVGVPKLSLPVVDKSRVTGVEVSGALAARLIKEGDAWLVVDPGKPDRKFPAEQSQVTAMLDALKDFRAGDFVSEKSERHAEFEVDEAKGVRVKVTHEGGKPLELVVGKAAKAGGVYIREPGGKPVWTTQSALARQVRKDAKGWRKRAFVMAKADELTRLAVALADGQGFVAQHKDGAWALDESVKPPRGFRFDPGSVQRIAQQLASLSAQDFGEPGAEDAAFGFDAPHAVVEAATKDGRTLKLHLGRAADATAPVPARLEGDPQVYLLPSYSAQMLAKRLEDLRDMSLASFEAAKAERLTITAAGKKTVVAREAGAWKLVEPKVTPAGYEFDPAQVTGQLETLRGLRGSRVVTDAKWSKPAITVDVKLEGGGSQKIELGSEVTGPNNSKQALAKGSVDALVYAVDPWVRQRLERGLDLFRKPPPAPPMGGMKGLEQLPPEIRQQIEAQLRSGR
ncbi:MAG TPA: DUF4340 domain-containing protein [Myxococcaceae bacterium]|nr:DUF4340 domain-containing protein [Myxococcaceae bacterium]